MQHAGRGQQQHPQDDGLRRVQPARDRRAINQRDERLRQFSARKKQKITVVFDHGIPGGWSRDLSTGPVKVLFAGSHSNADRVIMERIREGEIRPPKP